MVVRAKNFLNIFCDLFVIVKDYCYLCLVKEMKESMDKFGKVLNALNKKGSGFEITFTPKNVASGDRFLIFSAYKKTTCTFTCGWSGIWRVWFDGDEPMLLEDCPESFFDSILKNI